MNGSGLGKLSVVFLVGAGICNAIGINVKEMPVLVVGLCLAIVAIIVGWVGAVQDKECELSRIGFKIGGVVAISWIVMHFVGWEMFFE